jgi:hypothetical protein
MWWIGRQRRTSRDDERLARSAENVFGNASVLWLHTCSHDMFLPRRAGWARLQRMDPIVLNGSPAAAHEGHL